MQHEVGSAADDALVFWNNVRRKLENGVHVDICAHFIERASGLFERRRKFLFGLDPRVAKRHLNSAMCVYLTLARGFDWQEYHILVVLHYGRLDAVGLRAGHAAERLQAKHHMADTFIGVVNAFGDFQVAFASARS